MISVLHVSQSTGYGIGGYLEDLIGDQVRRGWQVTAATPPSELLESTCRALDVPHHRWDAVRSVSARVVPEVLALRRILGKVPADVIHLHSSKAGLIGRLAIRGSRPTIFSPHAWSFLHEGGILQRGARRWERTATRWTDVILCTSAAEEARGKQAGVRGPFRVVRNAINLENFRAAQPDERAHVRAQLQLPDAPLAVCVGRLVAQKGQDLLLAAWPEVRAAVPGASLVLVGEGDLRSELERLAIPGVVLIGETGEVRSWLVAADVIVQPSRWEGMSLSVLEALACGRSIVVSDVEGMREAIGDDPTDRAGAIVPVDDRGSLAAAITERLQNPELAESEGRRARERASRFGVGPWGDAIAAVTEQVIATRVTTT